MTRPPAPRSRSGADAGSRVARSQLLQGSALGREQSFSTLYCHRTRRLWPLLSKTLDLTEHAGVAHKSGSTEF